MAKAVLTLAMALMATGALAGEPVRYTPAGPWQIDYDKDSCHLARSFTHEGDSLLLIMDRVKPGAQVEIRLMGKVVHMREARARDTRVQFGDPDPGHKVEPLNGKSHGQDTLMFPAMDPLIPGAVNKSMHGAEAAALPGGLTQGAGQSQAQRDTIRFIAFQPAGMAPLQLETGALGAPLAALDACMGDLMKSWGYVPSLR